LVLERVWVSALVWVLELVLEMVWVLESVRVLETVRVPVPQLYNQQNPPGIPPAPPREKLATLCFSLFYLLNISRF